MTKDLNDRAHEGTLPSDPADESVDIAPDLGQRKAVLRVVGDGERQSRGLPMDLPAESALLAALLWAGTYQPGLVTPAMVSDLIGPDALANEGHRHVYEAIAAQHEANAPTDTTTVHSAMLAKGQRAISHDHLEQMAQSATPPSPERLRAYAQAIRDAWIRRELIAAAAKIADAARSNKAAPSMIAARSRELVARVAETALGGEARVVLMNAAVKRIHDSFGSATTVGWRTGYRDLDPYLGALFATQTTVLAARTSVGKSALAAAIARRVVNLHDDVGVAYVTLEMLADRFALRLASADARIDIKRIVTDNGRSLGGAEHKRLLDATSDLAKKPLAFIEARGMTMPWIQSALSRASVALGSRNKRLGLVVLDHIGLIKRAKDEQRMQREEFVALISSWCRALAEQLNCHVIALAQISREAEKQKGKQARPQLWHLRESGALEQDPDNVLLLHRRRDFRGQFFDEPAELIIAKQRDGRTGWLKLDVDPEFTLFDDHDEERYPAPKATAPRRDEQPTGPAPQREPGDPQLQMPDRQYVDGFFPMEDEDA